MALTIQDSKIRIKRTTLADQIPSMAPSQDHTDGSWNANNIYKGEFYLNETDARLWIGTAVGIKEIPIINGLLPIGAADTIVKVNTGGSALEYLTFFDLSGKI